MGVVFHCDSAMHFKLNNAKYDMSVFKTALGEYLSMTHS